MTLSGFEELPHTADWAMKVWAADLAGLLKEAAVGMNFLMGVRLQPDESWNETLVLAAADAESLLVAFLNRILLEMELNHAGYEPENIKVDELMLSAQLRGALLEKIHKSIKAATFHNLAIVRTETGGIQATIVFDV